MLSEGTLYIAGAEGNDSTTQDLVVGKVGYWTIPTSGGTRQWHELSGTSDRGMLISIAKKSDGTIVGVEQKDYFTSPNSAAVLWNGTTEHSLPKPEGATSLLTCCSVVDHDETYVGGMLLNSLNMIYESGYWKGDEWHSLKYDNRIITFAGIKVFDGVVVAYGYFNESPKQGAVIIDDRINSLVLLEVNKLPSSDNGTEVNDATLNGNKFVLCGSAIDNTDHYYPVVWTIE